MKDLDPKLRVDLRIQRHLFVACQVENRSVNALIDTGCSGLACIDLSLAQKVGAALYELPNGITVYNFDGEASFRVTHAAVFELQIDRHKEVVAALVMPIQKWPVILGLPWLEKHKANLAFGPRELTFGEHCIHNGHCEFETTVQYHQNQRRKFPAAPGQSGFHEPGSRRESAHQISPTRPKLEMQTKGATTIPPPVLLEPRGPPAIALSATTFAREARRKGAQVFVLSLREIDKILGTDPMPRRNVATVRVGNTIMHIPKDADAKDYLPSEYHEFLDVFDRSEAKKLPPHRPEDHHIRIQPGKEPPNCKIYPMNRKQLEALRETLETELSKGFIRVSRSPAAAPVLFTRKANGDLRFCVDYRGLNSVTVKNRYPLPLVSETLDRLSKARYFTKLDIIAAFNKLRIAEGDEWKTAFQTRYGLFEYLVMPFGLCNGPASFQEYINKALRGLLDDFCTAYIDDILIYSKDLKEHRGHVKQVLKRLQEYGLQVDISKCEFDAHEVQYLGLIINTNGIRMDPKKVAAVMEWPVPTSVKDVQGFLGFANFYRRFIPEFSKIAKPLTALTKKDVQFIWSDACQAAFLRIKNRFEEGGMLAHFDPDRKTVLETDASDYVSGAVLSQYDDQGILRPIAFMSKKMLPAECNYEIYDKELLAIIRAFEEWTAELESVAEPTQVLSDHKNLEYFMSTKKLTARQARWSEFLTRFRFQVDYRPGRKSGKPDALTRISADKPKSSDDDRVKQRMQQVIKDYQILRPIDPAAESTADDDSTENLDWQSAYNEDPCTQRIRRELESGANTDIELQLPDCQATEHGFTYNGRHYVPETLRTRILQCFHDSPAYGHRGADALFGLLRRSYFWPSMHVDVTRFCRGCESCGRNNFSTRKPFGLLHPLEPPQKAFRHLTLDFMGPLPESRFHGEDCRFILQVVDRLTKRVWLVPMSKISAYATARAFIEHVFRFAGLPDSLISDQGRTFINKLWKTVCHQLKIKHRMSTAYHPETDGQTERANRTVETYLRHYVGYLQDDWAKWLPIAEFCANNHVNASTGVTPFFAAFGHHPRMEFEPESSAPATRDSAEFVEEMRRVHEHCRDAMSRSQAFQAAQANRHRLPVPKFKVGDRVFLDVRHLQRQRPTEKLDHVRAGPYTITQLKTPLVVKLDLPPNTGIDNKFHVSLLRPCSPDAFPEQQQQQPPPLKIHEDSQPIYEVDSIQDSRYRYRKLQYLVKWIGYEDPTWEPCENVDNADDAIQEYHGAYPQRPGPEATIRTLQQSLRVAVMPLGIRRSSCL